jgi:hypothetical protein
VTPPLSIGPGERDHDPVAPRLKGIEAVVASAEQPLLRYPFVENLTGLVGAMSGRRPEKPPQSPPSAPLHLGVDQRDERLNVALSEGLIRGANRINSHTREATPTMRGPLGEGARRRPLGVDGVPPSTRLLPAAGANEDGDDKSREEVATPQA